MSDARKIWSLSQINLSIKRLLHDRVGTRRFWVRAEISNYKKAKSGHAYLDLVEHLDSKIVARSRCVIWRSKMISIEYALGNDIEHVLKDGSEILCELSIAFDEVYGLSLSISAIDLNFTIGSLQKQREATIKRLVEEGIFDYQRKIQLPRVVQTIAVIGSRETSGMIDFLDQTLGNEWGFTFNIDIYHAAVQGQHAIQEVVNALVATSSKQYDAIVLVRGGGSKLDLSTFDSYEIAQAIANHPTPVITGIGHETDHSVADMVANTHTKTPSAVGAYLIEEMLTFDATVNNVFERIQKRCALRFVQQKKFIEVSANAFKNKSVSYTQLRRGELHKSASKITRLSLSLIEADKQHLRKSRLLLETRPKTITDKKLSDLQIAITRLKTPASTSLQKGKHQVELLSRQIKAASSQQLVSNKQEYSTLQLSIELAIDKYIKDQWNSLDSISNLIRHLHPTSTLSKGFAIIRHDEQVVDKNTKLKKGDILEVEIFQKKFIVQFIENDIEWKHLKRSLTKMLQKN